MVTAILFVIFTFQDLTPAPPLPGLDIGPGPKEHVHHKPDINFLRTTGLSERAIQQAIGATGTKNVAVILVNFSSAGTGTSGSSTMTLAEISSIATMITNMRNYYLEVSGSSLTINPTYIYTGGATKTFSQGLDGSENPISLTNPMESYGTDGVDIDSRLYYLFQDAITAAGITKGSPYDAVVIIHAGFGQESTGKGGDIWSQFLKLSPTVNGFTEGTVVPVKEAGDAEPLGVFCHEFGHQLGLPDLYNTSTGKPVVGYWCLMDAGTWAGSPKSGSSPSHMSVWCKKLLGWVNPSVESGTKVLTANNIEQNKTGSSYQFSILNSSTEYFLIEYRRKILFDAQLPGEGILIWHIDETVGNIESNNINADTDHLRIKLVEADKNNKLIEITAQNKSDKGSASDPFRSSGDLFTMPQSDSYSKASSGITMTDFLGVGNPSMTVSSYILASTSNLEAKKVFGFPNPSKDGTPIRIRAIFSRPIASGNIKIYNIAGELVKPDDITSSNIVISASKDYEWVYEYIWDLRNSSGNDISPGVYVYVVEALITETEKQVKVGKLSIIK